LSLQSLLFRTNNNAEKEDCQAEGAALAARKEQKEKEKKAKKDK